MDQSGPQISVVIPALGNQPVLARVLDALAAQDLAAISFEVLVVVDSAEPDPDATREVIGERPYRVRLLSGERPGASANRNAGWRAAAAPIILFIDSDTIPVPRLLSEHAAWHRRFAADHDIVIGPVRWARGLKVTPFMKWLEHGIQFDFGAIDGIEASWAHVYSANCSVKRPFLERVGGYDEHRLPYLYEDLDWGYRAREHGLRVWFNRRAVVDHWRPMTIADWQARAPRLAMSEWRFCQLHPDFRPWFQPLFAEAAALPSGGRRSAAIVGFVPRRTPLLGSVVWGRASLYWRQQIAPYFLRAWEEARSAPDQSAAAVSGREASSGGSSPGGPK